MQQYFINHKIELNQAFELDKEIYHHQKHVLRSGEGAIFRIVDNSSVIYLCKLDNHDAIPYEILDENHELAIDVTIVMSLIKNEKFDYCLQKLTELGVKRIVPYEANHSIIKIKDKNAKLERYRKIVKEASEQSHRNIVPEIPDIIDVKKLEQYLSKHNYVAYEKQDCTYIPYQSLDGSITIIIGPEGGFETGEIKKFQDLGFKAISLGKRILRAETAALYCMANIAGAMEK